MAAVGVGRLLRRLGNVSGGNDVDDDDDDGGCGWGHHRGRRRHRGPTPTPSMRCPRWPAVPTAGPRAVAWGRTAAAVRLRRWKAEIWWADGAQPHAAGWGAEAGGDVRAR